MADFIAIVSTHLPEDELWLTVHLQFMVPVQGDCTSYIQTGHCFAIFRSKMKTYLLKFHEQIYLTSLIDRPQRISLLAKC